MDLHPLSPAFAVAPQIAPEDMPALAAAGFTTVINNRPDDENPPQLQSAAMQAAAAAAGLAYHYRPATRPTITPEGGAEQAALIEPGARVLAYCASGTRSTMLWALGQIGKMEADAILRATAAAGYDLTALRPTLEG